MKLEQAIKVIEVINQQPVDSGFQQFVGNTSIPHTVGNLCELTKDVSKDLVYFIIKHISGNDNFNDSTPIKYFGHNVAFSTNYGNDVQIFQKRISDYYLFMQGIINA
jgi:hypothetical protein